jgi:hypothetical protein
MHRPKTSTSITNDVKYTACWQVRVVEESSRGGSLRPPHLYIFTVQWERSALPTPPSSRRRWAFSRTRSRRGGTWASTWPSAPSPQIPCCTLPWRGRPARSKILLARCGRWRGHLGTSTVACLKQTRGNTQLRIRFENNQCDGRLHALWVADRWFSCLTGTQQTALLCVQRG